MHQQVASIPTLITVPYMNIPAITDASTDTVEENICDHLGTNPIRLNAKDILLETFDMMGAHVFATTYYDCGWRHWC